MAQTSAPAATNGNQVPSEPLEQRFVGQWRTIDERSREPTSIVDIRWEHGELVVTIAKILKPGIGDTARCVKCKGELKDKPLIGMKIVWGLTRQGEELAGGHVVDPSTGRIYRAKMRLIDADHLELRGYLGIAALGRSQTWQREKTP